MQKDKAMIDIDKERALFSAWAKSENFNPNWHSVAKFFTCTDTQVCWEVWQARASTPPATADTDENAPWLTLAHIICADAGIPVGHINDRLKALRDTLEALQAPKHTGASDGIIIAQKFMEWNRSQNEPPVAIPKELFVAGKVLSIQAGLAAKNAHTAAPAAPEGQAEALAKLDRVSRWINKFPVPTDGATAMMCLIRDVKEYFAAVPRQAAVGGEWKMDWQLVPKKPTPEMLSAMLVFPDFVGTTIIRHSVDKLPGAYRAMLAAAPAAPQGAPAAKGEKP